MNHLKNHIGVWLDHHQAVFVYPVSKHNYHIEKMESEHDLHPREDGQYSDKATFGKYRTSNNEYHKHNLANDQLNNFYHSLAKLLVKYDEILLHGPTTAKDELFNFLMDKREFNGKRIEIESTEKMNDHKMIEYVKSFFEMRTLK
ncbi:MAG: hypothetical protein HY064_15915 [Bacteroidetes bacterium]|nr:hypothetical protein [Bacteroidota bacterium]